MATRLFLMATSQIENAQLCLHKAKAAYTGLYAYSQEFVKFGGYLYIF